MAHLITSDSNSFKQGLQTFHTNRNAINTQQPSPTMAKSSMDYARRSPTQNLYTSQTNFLSRRLMNRRSTKVFGGTSESVSPHSYHLKQLTGSTNVFESNFRQAPQISFGREDTGRGKIRNNHKTFFSFYNYRSGSIPDGNQISAEKTRNSRDQ